MQPLRALIRSRHRLALALLVLAFCIKAAIPAGFMVSTGESKLLTVLICSDVTGAEQQVQMVIATKHNDSGNPSAKAPCAFAGLSSAMLGGADMALLALAFAFILILGLAPAARLPFARNHHLRPPLRGPPVFA